MPDSSLIRPARRAWNPILADESVIDAPDGAAQLFYTAGARRISQLLPLIIAGSAGLFLLIGWVISLAGGPQPRGFPEDA